MSNQVTDLEKTKALLKHTNKRLRNLKKSSVFERGHLDNEDLVRLEFRKKQLRSTIKLFKKGKIKPKPIKNNSYNNGEYL